MFLIKKISSFLGNFVYNGTSVSLLAQKSSAKFHDYDINIFSIKMRSSISTEYKFHEMRRF